MYCRKSIQHHRSMLHIKFKFEFHRHRSSPRRTISSIPARSSAILRKGAPARARVAGRNRARSNRWLYVDAPDAESAIKETIDRFGITDREQQQRLVARPVR
jgi:hypothetical protein